MLSDKTLLCKLKIDLEEYEIVIGDFEFKNGLLSAGSMFFGVDFRETNKFLTFLSGEGCLFMTFLNKNYFFVFTSFDKINVNSNFAFRANFEVVRGG